MTVDPVSLQTETNSQLTFDTLKQIVLTLAAIDLLLSVDTFNNLTNWLERIGPSIAPGRLAFRAVRRKSDYVLWFREWIRVVSLARSEHFNRVVQHRSTNFIHIKIHQRTFISNDYNTGTYLQ